MYHKRLSKQEFSLRMNEYYKDVNEKWSFEGREYTTGANFTSIQELQSIETPLVYKWGKLYHATVHHDRVMLYDIYTKRYKGRTSFKNIKPVMRIS